MHLQHGGGKLANQRLVPLQFTHQPLALDEVVACFVLPRTRPQRHAYCVHQRRNMDGTIQQHHVTQLIGGERRNRGIGAAGGDNDHRHVRPSGLPADAFGQRPDLFQAEAILGKHGGAGARVNPLA